MRAPSADPTVFRNTPPPSAVGIARTRCRRRLLTSLEEAIEQERELVAALAEFGHQIDTSNLRANVLRAWVIASSRRSAGLDADVRIVRIQARRAARRRFRLRRPHIAEPRITITRTAPADGLISRSSSIRSALPIVHQMIDDIGNIHREMAAAISRRQPQLSDGRDWLYGRPASIGIHRPGARRALRRRRQ